MSKFQEEIIVGLDIGTSNISVVVALKKDREPLEVIGLGLVPAKGIKKGIVVDLESATEAIIRAIEIAEETADVEVASAFVSVSGNHIQGVNSTGTIPITNEDKEITEDDVEKTIAAAKAVSLPMERMILHVIPQEFSIDGTTGVRDPRGMSGVRLEVGVHIISAAKTMIDNIQKCMDRARVHCEGFVLSSMASAEATLTREEKDMGVVLIDMGGGTTDIIVYSDGSIKFTLCIGGGGFQITNDVAVGLRFPTSKAEEIKKRHGSALRSSVGASEEFVLPGVLGRSSQSMTARDLAGIIEARVEETFMIVKDQLAHSGYQNKIGAGLVLTGGSARLKNMDKLAARVFNVPVRIATPRDITGSSQVLESPGYATGAGLLGIGLSIREEKQDHEPGKRRVWDVVKSGVSRLLHREH